MTGLVALLKWVLLEITAPEDHEPVYEPMGLPRDAASLIFNLPDYRVIAAADVPRGGRRVEVESTVLLRTGSIADAHDAKMRQGMAPLLPQRAQLPIPYPAHRRRESRNVNTLQQVNPPRTAKRFPNFCQPFCVSGRGQTGRLRGGVVCGAGGPGRWPAAWLVLGRCR
jgi:hypothetical protein